MPFCTGYAYIYIYIYIYIYLHIAHAYIYIERERENKHVHLNVYRYIDIHTYVLQWYLDSLGSGGDAPFPDRLRDLLESAQCS